MLRFQIFIDNELSSYTEGADLSGSGFLPPSCLFVRPTDGPQRRRGGKAGPPRARHASGLAGGRARNSVFFSHGFVRIRCVSLVGVMEIEVFLFGLFGLVSMFYPRRLWSCD